MFQLGEMSGVRLEFRQLVAEVEGDDAFQTAPSRDEIGPRFIHRGEKSEHRSFGWFIAEFDVMLRGVVETTLGSGQISLVEIALAELAISHRQAFFIPDNPMVVEGLRERGDGLFPLTFTRFLERQVVIENAERAVVVKLA